MDEQVHVPAELFAPVPPQEKLRNEIVRPSMSYWQDAWRRLRANPLAMIGLVIVIFMTFLALFAPLLTPYDYYSQDLYNANAVPSKEHWLGTDQFGRDLLTRILFGARISMTVAYVSTLLVLVIGVTYGGVSGYFGGKVDNVMMRIADILSGVPSMLYLILLMVVLGPGLVTIIIAMGIANWIGMARMVRAEVLKLKNQEFVMAARALGVNNRKILFRHLLPNSMGTIIVNLTFAIPGAIFAEAFLSFIGLGVSAPQASWGMMVSEAMQMFMAFPLNLFWPALAICITILGFNFLGDGLRDALDPKMRK
ncbi:MAG TPA: ABC transporter permease [Thermotogota bacterium]|nr:ABC transporter permease [Thermotogota bacterium]HRW92517.1 ABC transporter permease [Thermotogota bacterium]